MPNAYRQTAAGKPTGHTVLCDRRRRSIVIGVLAAAVIAFTASVAWATFSAPVTLSQAGGNALGGPVAVDSTGKATVVWARNDGSHYRIQARAITPFGLGTTETLSAPGEDAIAPVIAVDSTGRATVAWYRFDGSNTRVQARKIAANGTLGAIKTLSRAGQDASQAQVAVDSTGKAIVVWRRSDGSDLRIQERKIAAGGALGAIKTLSAPNGSAISPQVAIDSTDGATVVWQRDAASIERIQARRIAANGTLDPIRTLAASAQNVAELPQVAIDSTGKAIVAWDRGPGSNTNIQARSIAPNGTLGTTQILSAPGGYAVNAQVAVDSTDKATVVWERFDGSDNLIQARAIAADGTLGTTETLSAAGQDAMEGQLAIDPSDTAIVVWDRSNGSINRVQARPIAADGTLGTTQTLSAAGPSADAFFPQIAIDPTGKATVGWGRWDGSEYAIQASQGP